MVLKEPTEQLLPDLITTTTAVSEKKKHVFCGCSIKVKNYKNEKKSKCLSICISVFGYKKRCFEKC